MARRGKLLARAGRPSLDTMRRVHLQLGDCLIVGHGRRDCGCGIRDIDGHFNAEAAAAHWAVLRGAILAGWNRPFPCFAQLVFREVEPAPNWWHAHPREAEIIASEVEIARSGQPHPMS
jgi:hypothetical protein